METRLELTSQQEKFCQLVAAGNTYSESYRIAYPKSKKWKIEVVWVESSKLMANTKVLLRVKEIQKQNLKRNQATLDEVINEMSVWFRFDLRDLFNADNTLKNVDKLSDDIRKCIASFEVLELYEGKGEKRTLTGYLKKVKMIDKLGTADKFLKTFGAYITKHKLDEDDLSHLTDIIRQIKE